MPSSDSSEAMIPFAVRLRLADPRDFREIVDGDASLLAGIKPIYPDTVTLTLDPGQELDVRRRGASVTATFSTENAARTDVVWQLDFDETELKVTQEGASEPRKKGEQNRLPMSGKRAVVKLFVEPLKPPTRQSTRQPLTIGVVGGEASAPKTLQCLLPRENYVQLSVDQFVLETDDNWRPATPSLGDQVLDNRSSATLRLEPYPNRETRYAFRLRNFADEEKKLEWKLVAVPPVADNLRHWPHGWLTDGSSVFREARNAVMTADYKLRDNVVVLAQGEVTLGVDTELPLPLEPPPPPAVPAGTPPPPLRRPLHRPPPRRRSRKGSLWSSPAPSRMITGSSGLRSFPSTRRTWSKCGKRVSATNV